MPGASSPGVALTSSEATKYVAPTATVERTTVCDQKEEDAVSMIVVRRQSYLLIKSSSKLVRHKFRKILSLY